MGGQRASPGNTDGTSPGVGLEDTRDPTDKTWALLMAGGAEGERQPWVEGSVASGQQC